MVPNETGRPQIVIAGGGVAALEAVMALREHLGDAAQITLIAPNEEFGLRPLSVKEPFAGGAASSYKLAPILSDFGVEQRKDVVTSVDSEARTVTTGSGDELSYDALLLALGAKAEPAYEHATTFDPGKADELLHGLVQDVEGGYSKSVLFLAPPHAAWPLPLYELALQLARRAWESQLEVEIVITTPEERPLAAFGGEVSEALDRLLAGAKIELRTSAHVRELGKGHFEVVPEGKELRAERVVALPQLLGPALDGVPADNDGFIPIDSQTRVEGVSAIYAAGDSTTYPVKHGSIAAQQADTAASQIAGALGADVQADSVQPIVRGILLTGAEPLYIEGSPGDMTGTGAHVHETPPWPEPGKIVAKRLAPYLEHSQPAG